jgi:hypothetical protein
MCYILIDLLILYTFSMQIVKTIISYKLLDLLIKILPYFGTELKTTLNI